MQKHVRIILSITLFSMSAYCQITKSNWMLGGNISFASTNRQSANFGPAVIGFDFQANPNVGYFFVDKLAVALKSSISKRGGKAPGTSTYTKYTTFSIGPSLRYYFLPTTNIINLFAEGCYQYGYEGGNNAKQPKHTLGFAGGSVAYLNTSVGIEFLVIYTTSKFAGIDGRNNTIQAGLGLQVHLEN